MGLLRSCLEVIAPHLQFGARVLSLGYQDLIVSNAELLELFPAETFPLMAGGDIKPHPDTGHPDTVELFRRLGCSLLNVDVERIRGPEVVADLNWPDALTQLAGRARYDLVLDAGTIEHCFNPGQALLNMADAVKVGGRIFHTPPLAMGNHGFYNLCPTLFADFYGQNGWEIELLVGRRNKGRGPAFDIPPLTRFEAPPASVMHCLARRTKDEPLVVPRQGKYA